MPLHPTVPKPKRFSKTRKALRRTLALGLVAGGLLAASAQAKADPRLVIFDDDGFSIAQWMIIKAPNVRVLGITTVTGDVWQKEATNDALRGVEVAGRADIPVVPGATYPFLNSEKLTDRWEALYGKLIWKGVWMKKWVEKTEQPLPYYHGPDVVPDLPYGNPVKKPETERAADFLIRMVHRYPGQVSIIATGPMTNIALAQTLDPEFAGLAKELVYMGGGLNPRQTRPGVVAHQFAREFLNSPRREFNFRLDPESASAALRAPWKHIVMVPADPSTDTELTPEFLKKLEATGTPVGHVMKWHLSGFPLWDEIAASVWLDPSIITEKQDLFVDVNSQFGPGYGDVVSWTPGYEPGLGERKNEVVLRINVPKLEKQILDLIGSPQAPVSGHPLP